MINLRSRGTSNRPFEIVENMQKDAELAFREKEISLQQELEETEKKLSEIKSGGTKNGNYDLEQSKTIEAFNIKISKIRRELREVQRELNQDIKNLESNLKILNIWLMPILVLLLFASLKVFSLKRKKVFYKSIGRIK